MIFIASPTERNMKSVFMDFLPVMTGSLGLLQSYSSGVYTLNFSVGASWFHLCIESYVIRSWKLTFVLRFLQILWTFTHTQTVVSSASTALDLLSVFQLSCSDIQQGPAIHAPCPSSCAHPITLTFLRWR